MSLEPASEMFAQLFLENAQVVTDEGLNQGGEGAENDDENRGHVPIPVSDESQKSSDSSAPTQTSSLSLHQEHFETFSDKPENGEELCNTANDSAEVYQLVDEATDVFSEDQQSERSSNVNNKDSEDGKDISDVVSQERDDCSLLESSLSKKLSQEADDLNLPESDLSTKLAQETDDLNPPECRLSKKISASLPSVSDDLLSEVSPVNSPASTLINEAVSSEDESVKIVDEIWNNTKNVSDNVPKASSSFSVAEDDEEHNSSELDSVSEIETVSSDTDENLPSEFVIFDASGGVIPGNSMPNLKRKMISSVDDDSIKKVPKFSTSQESNDSIVPHASRSSSFSVAEDDEKHTLSELDSVSDIEITVSSDTDENSSEEMNANQEKNASYDVIPGKSVPNLKRKIISSVDDGSIKKVPKMSVSQESNDSISKVFLDNNEENTSADIVSIVSSSSAVAENDEKKHNLSELDSASSETGENSHPEFVTVDVVSSEEVNTSQEKNASCVVTSNNLVPKPKIISSIVDDSINKVPNFSVSKKSNDSDNNSSESSDAEI